MSYDPTIGRWMQEDPIDFEGGDLNLYRYVGNGPTNATDPSGLQIQGGGGFVIGLPTGLPRDPIDPRPPWWRVHDRWQWRLRHGYGPRSHGGVFISTPDHPLATPYPQLGPADPGARYLPPVSGEPSDRCMPIVPPQSGRE